MYGTNCRTRKRGSATHDFLVSTILKGKRTKQVDAGEKGSAIHRASVIQPSYRNVENIADLSKENKAWTKVRNSSSEVTEKIARKNFNRFSVFTLEDSEDSSNDEDDNNKDDDKKLIPTKMLAKPEKAAKACQPGKLSSKPNDKLEDMNHSIQKPLKGEDGIDHGEQVTNEDQLTDWLLEADRG